MPSSSQVLADREHLTVFLCGDVMTGRGVDQTLPHPAPPELHEPFVRDARDYRELAEQAHGPISAPLDDHYIWGDALDEWKRVGPDARIVNLETAVTTSDKYWEGKEVHYRMSPANVGCLIAAEIDCCTLANNHVLDWGYPGLEETLETLEQAGIQAVGAGRNEPQARAPAILDVGRRTRVLVFSFGSETSGIPRAWAAGEDTPGVNLLPDLSEQTVENIGKMVAERKRDTDVVVASLHWGGNWGYEVPRSQRQFAQGLIDRAQVDVVHGHSSHHVKGIEIYRDRPIFYGCGDFLTDYEGIGGHESFRGDLGLMYFVTIEPSTARLVNLQMTPTQVHQMRLHRPPEEDVLRLCELLNREGERFGTSVEVDDEKRLRLQWK